MAKRARLDENLIESPSDTGERGSAAASEEGPEVNKEGLKEATDTIGEPIYKDEVRASEQVAEGEELDDGSFWASLIRAGYTSW